MEDQWTKFEQLAAAAVREMKEAQRFYVMGTDEAREISRLHILKADSYIKQCNDELPFKNEQEQ